MQIIKKKPIPYFEAQYERNIIAFVVHAAVLCISVLSQNLYVTCTFNQSVKVLQFTKSCRLIFGNRFTVLGKMYSRFTSKHESRIVTQNALRQHYMFKC
jgi:hypothetical protein